MANTNAIRAGRAFVELFADDTKLVRGLRSAERKLRAFGASISRLGRQMVGLGAALLTPLVAAGKAFSTMGDGTRSDKDVQLGCRGHCQVQCLD